MLGFYRTHTTPFKEKISISSEDYFQRKPLYKRFTKFIGRYLYTKIILKRSQKLEAITKQHQKILWIRTINDCFGDSLSDLSSRILLKDKQIDLLTKKNTAKIYQNDEIFNQVFTNTRDCNADYDLIIISNYRKRELKNIPKKLLSIPHVFLYGYFSVNDFNTLYFSFFRMNQLLAQPYTEKYIYNNAKPLLPITNQDKKNVNYYGIPNDFIAISIGGVDVKRTFHAWDKVIAVILLENPKQNIVLVGKDNSNKMAKKILKKHSKNVQDLSNKLSFNQTAEVINRAEILLCCDGGLMHASNSVQTPVVALFYYIEPVLRLIKANSYEALLNEKDVNNIGVDEIMVKVRLLQEKINGE